MKKIPAGEAINFAYSFTFGHVGAIIGLVWLPLVLWGVGDYFMLAHQYQAMTAAMAAGDPMSAAQANLAALGWNLVAALLWSVMSVAVVRQAMGLRQGPAIVHFALGGAELRVFAATMGLALLLILFLAALVMLVLTLKGAMAAAPLAGRYVVPTIALLGAAAILYAAIRLSFFIVPVAAAEQRIGLSRSWELAGGNVGRIVLIGLAALLPAFLLVSVLQAAVVGPDYFAAGGASLFSLTKMADTAQALQRSRAQMQVMADHLPAFIGIMLVTAPFVLGLQLAPAAYAYKAVAGGSNPKG